MNIIIIVQSPSTKPNMYNISTNTLQMSTCQNRSSPKLKLVLCHKYKSTTSQKFNVVYLILFCIQSHSVVIHKQLALLLTTKVLLSLITEKGSINHHPHPHSRVGSWDCSRGRGASRPSPRGSLAQGSSERGSRCHWPCHLQGSRRTILVNI